MEVMIKSRLVFGLLVVFVLLGPAEMLAQLTRGLVSGTVTDQSNAVIPGASIVIVNKATNIQQETLTRTRRACTGLSLSSLERIQFRFRCLVLRLARQTTLSSVRAQEVVINQTLAVGGGAAVVEVNVTPPGVQLAKTTPTIDRTFSERVIAEMPITGNTRDVTRLALLAPTVNRAPGSNEFSANGQRARNNNFLIDGTDNNDLSVTLTNSRIIPEAVGEFQVQTTAYSRIRTQQRSAGLDYYQERDQRASRRGLGLLRGNWVQPLSLLNRRAGLEETPRFVQNQVGGDLAGPVLKDRTLFLACWKRIAGARLPTPAMLRARTSRRRRGRPLLDVPAGDGPDPAS